MSKVWQHLYSKQQSLVSVTNWPKYVWGQTCPLYSFLVHTDMEKKEEMKSGLLLDVIIQKGAVVLKLHTDMETKDKMKSGILLDVIIQKSVVIFEPLMTHHWWVSSWRSNAETNKEMKSGLLLDGIVQKSVVILELFASKHENPHTNAEMKDKMRSGLLLDVIVQKSAVVLKPFSSKYKDLHTNMEMKDKMKIRCYGPKEHGLPWTIFQWIWGIVSWEDAFLILNLCLHVVDHVQQLYLEWWFCPWRSYWRSACNHGDGGQGQGGVPDT